MPDDAPSPVPVAASADSSFSVKTLYLREFQHRTFAVLAADPPTLLASVLGVLDELRANGTRVILVTPAEQGRDTLNVDEPRLEGRIWRELRSKGRVVVHARGEPGTAFGAVVAKTRPYKAIRLCAGGGLRDVDGVRRPFVDARELQQILATGPPRAELLREIERLLDAGIAKVNVCTAEGLHDELFSYSGTGTLFTRGRYIAVRSLGIDDYDAANDLISRGVAEGFLAPRSEQEIDVLLADSFGAFIEGSHLAGIGALRCRSDTCVGEVSSLYALTRFAGEGVGSRLVQFALKTARDRGLDWAFACTTSSRVVRFFRRHGFHEVGPEELPADKWQDYDAARRELVVCLRHDL